MSDPAFVYVIYIRATPERIWEALTTADLKQKFWFGRRCESDWKAGSDHLLRAPDGSVDFIGKVMESDPPRKLVYTFDKQRETEDPTTVTYLLEPQDETVRLTVTHDGFPDNSDIRVGVSNGWPAILSALKSLLETGQAPARMGG